MLLADLGRVNRGSPVLGHSTMAYAWRASAERAILTGLARDPPERSVATAEPRTAAQARPVSFALVSER